MAWTRMGMTALFSSALRNSGVALALLACIGLVGCDDATDAAADAAPDVSADTGVDIVPDTTDGVDLSVDDISELVCTPGEFVAQFTGHTTDEESQPTVGAKVQLCVRPSSTGNLVCLNWVDTDVSGAFNVSMPVDLQCLESAVVRVLVPGTSTTTSYCDVEIEGEGPIVEVSSPFVIYETTAATTIPPVGDATAERTVVFADGLEIDIVPDRFASLNYDVNDYSLLAAARLDDVAADQCFLADAPALDGLYAFSPEADVDDASFTMRIPNTSGLAAGTSVSLFVLGGLFTSIPPDDTTVRESEWYEYGTGVVADGGATIEAELPYFSWFGYRAQ